METTPLDRRRGALLGLVVGDALGTTLEFQLPGSFTPIAGMMGGGPFRLKPGEWTDDASMALCLAESLVTLGHFDPIDQLERYVRWYRHGHLSSTGQCFDIGHATRQALQRFERTRDPWSGSTDRDSAGNGSIMRLAPIAIFYAHDARAALEHAGDSSRTTHAARDCIDACRYLCAVLIGAMRGASKEDILATRYAPILDYWSEQPLSTAIDEVACGSFKHREPPMIHGSGHVVHSLEAALWAFHGSSNFRDAVLRAVNLGDDADTTGAVCGQIAGAYYGESGIPVEWIQQLARRELIELILGALITRA
ncbi:MAG: ADP-ribosylglycohydrolase family protein [Longimicrobiales bacterium]